MPMFNPCDPCCQTGCGLLTIKLTFQSAAVMRGVVASLQLSNGGWANVGDTCDQTGSSLGYMSFSRVGNVVTVIVDIVRFFRDQPFVLFHPIKILPYWPFGFANNTPYDVDITFGGNAYHYTLHSHYEATGAECLGTFSVMTIYALWRPSPTALPEQLTNCQLDIRLDCDLCPTNPGYWSVDLSGFGDEGPFFPCQNLNGHFVLRPSTNCLWFTTFAWSSGTGALTFRWEPLWLGPTSGAWVFQLQFPVGFCSYYFWLTEAEFACGTTNVLPKLLDACVPAVWPCSPYIPASVTINPGT